MQEEEEKQVNKESEEAETAEAAEEAEETVEKQEEVLEEVEAEAEKPLAEEEVKPPSREEAEEEIVEERVYTIPLSKAWIMPPRKRAPKAMRILKGFIRKHMKLEARKEVEEGEEEGEPKKLIISNEVNERVWRKGIEKPPRKIRVRAAKDKDGNVTVYLAEGD